MTMDTLIDLVNSADYNALLEKVKAKIDIEIDNNGVIGNYYFTRLNSANIKAKDLKAFIEVNADEISSFVEMKLRKYADDKEEEYPEGYEPDDEKDNNIVILPFNKSFLIGYLIEYWILKENPREIENYVRAIRIPNANKYAKELLKMYSKINS